MRPETNSWFTLPRPSPPQKAIGSSISRFTTACTELPRSAQDQLKLSERSWSTLEATQAAPSAAAGTPSRNSQAWRMATGRMMAMATTATTTTAEPEPEMAAAHTARPTADHSSQDGVMP